MASIPIFLANSASSISSVPMIFCLTMVSTKSINGTRSGSFKFKAVMTRSREFIVFTSLSEALRGLYLTTCFLWHEYLFNILPVGDLHQVVYQVLAFPLPQKGFSSYNSITSLSMDAPLSVAPAVRVKRPSTPSLFLSTVSHVAARCFNFRSTSSGP